MASDDFERQVVAQHLLVTMVLAENVVREPTASARLHTTCEVMNLAATQQPEHEGGTGVSPGRIKAQDAEEGVCRRVHAISRVTCACNS